MDTTDLPAGEPAEPHSAGAATCGRFQILNDRRMPELDVPGADAYAAVDPRNPAQALFARVCEPGLYPRSDALLRLRVIGGVHVLQPLHAGPVEGDGEAETRFATIFGRADHGAALMPSLAASIPPMAPEEISRRVLAPAAATLAQFAQRGIAHRAIRPTNVLAPPTGADLCSLGDCVSTPPGWGQPAFAEPIEMMMCEADARGAGTIADDLYALGATILALAVGFVPTRELDDEALLRAKVEHGSYAALLQGARAPRPLRDLLRGLLDDDLAARWDFDDIDRWLSGAQRQPTTHAGRSSSERTFCFADGEYRQATLLAQAFGRNWQAAPEAIHSTAFQGWIRRGVGDGALSDGIAELLAASPPTRRTAARDALLVSRVCMVLDPAGPLRFKGARVMPDGIGAALGRALREGNQERLGVLHECLQSPLVEEWLKVQSDAGRRHIDPRPFDRVREFARHKGPGYGVERAAYELDRNLPCLSGILGGRRISDLHDVMPALEAMAARPGSLDVLIDRHLPAYIARHLTRAVDHHLAEIASAAASEPAAKLGMVRLLAEVQELFGPPRLEHLTRWAAGEIRPLAMSFRSRSNREKLLQQLDRAADAGRLAALVVQLGSPRFRQNDQRGYAAATRRYADLARQIAEQGSDARREEARRLGLSVAAGLSTAFALFTAVAVTLH